MRQVAAFVDLTILGTLVHTATLDTNKTAGISRSLIYQLMYLVKHYLITNNIVMFALLLKCPSCIDPIMLQSTLKILPYKYKPVQIKHILNRLDLSICV